LNIKKEEEKKKKNEKKMRRPGLELATSWLKSGGNMGGVSNPELRQLTLF
jgi:hypothetical protein